jgi:hypothetical protein
MAGGGGNAFPTEGAEQRIRAALAAHPQLMRMIAGMRSPGEPGERDE